MQSSLETVNAADLAEMMGMSRGAAWHAASIMQKHAPQFRRDTQSDLHYEQDHRGSWAIVKDHAQHFADWWLGVQAERGVSAKWVLICHEAFRKFQEEMEEMGAGDALELLGITDPFFDRVEPDETKWKK